MTLPVSFDFEGQSVRTFDKDGVIWFVLVDICKVLEIENNRNAAARLDDDEKDDVHTVDAIGRNQPTTIINESGLYSLILTSRKDAAKRFKKWVTAEVLPALRRHGHYEMPGIVPVSSRKNLPPSAIPRSERHYDLALVREARATFGEAGARYVWANSSTLPDMASMTDQERLDDLARMRAEDCLRYLLRYSMGRGVPMAEMIVFAQYRDDVKIALEERGIKVSPVRHRGKVILASDHPFLNKVFAPTDWAGIYQRVLKDLPGSHVTRHSLTFGDEESPGVVVPLVIVNNIGGF
ncbi:BRO-N domain-containing protein [Thalassospira lucentensis]|uniref:BRO-N domain-containing protein n=1 Tax=Thalassospira lucentensis TaxID=168935 RepID=UPI003D284674